MLSKIPIVRVPVHRPTNWLAETRYASNLKSP